MNNDLVKFLGEENTKTLQERIMNLILESFKRDLEEYREESWLFDFSEFFEKVSEEVKAEIREEVADVLRKKMRKKVDAIMREADL